jgi:protoporphyrinogen oxidase
MGKRYLVLGAGISGLAAARALLHKNQEVLVLEAAPTVGGLTRTIVVSGFSFDYTGHLLHLSRSASPSSVPFAGLKDKEWQKISRNAVALVGNKLVPAPVQYNLAEVPEPLRSRFIDSYESRPSGGVSSFKDYIVQGFGEALSDEFLIPQNEKTLATSLERLSDKAVKRFFPQPVEQKVRAGMQPGGEKPVEYNSQFWYPKTGGIEKLVRGLEKGVPVRIMTEVAEVCWRHNKVIAMNGEEFAYDELISCIPLNHLCRITEGLEEYAPWLTHSQTVVLNLGVRGPVPQELEGVHWIYVPDRTYPFYRVGIYSNFSKGMAPEGYHSFYVEMGVPGHAQPHLYTLQQNAMRKMEAVGWLRTGDLVCSVLTTIPCAYVHHTPEREAVMEILLPRLKELRITPIGRYGTWDYTSMEDSIYGSIEAMEALV